MIKKTLIPLAILSFLGGYSQEIKRGAEEASSKVNVSQCTYFGVSKPLSEIIDLAKGENNAKVPANGRDREPRQFSKEALHTGNDPVLQSIQGTRTPLPILQNFNGTTGVYVPDPSGAAGKDHYVQAVNMKYQVFDKKGKSVKGPFDLNSLWPGSENTGDPIVMYDEFAERWFISQFQDPSEIFVALSKTEDALGEYYTYKFKVNEFPDYFKVSIWPDAYCITANSSGDNVIALEREKMLAGDESARVIGINHNFVVDGFTSPLPADADGELPPLGTPNYIFTFEDDGWDNATKDALKIYEFKIDWSNPESSTVKLHQTLDPEPFDTQIGEGWENIAQKGTDQKIDAVLDIFNYRAQYRRWVEYNTVTLAHTVDADGNDKAGIRWYELRDDGAGQWSIFQQGTYAPDDHSRFIPSIGMDKFGNIGMGYNTSSKDLYPGLRYTGRLKNDPLGKMTIDETVAIEGAGARTDGERFGDYSHLTLDPTDGTTFWFTGEHVGGPNESLTRIFSFRIAEPINIEGIEQEEMLIKINSINDEVIVNVENLEDNKELVVDLFSLRGELLKSGKVVPVNKSFNYMFNVSGLAKGAYLVRFGNKAFQEVSKVIID